MIIDADCHISPYPIGITYDELLRRMDKSGVEQAITWLQPPYYTDEEESNAYVYEAAQKHPDRILPFGWANPHHGINKAIDTIKRCTEEFGFLGVKLNGAQNSFLIDDEKMAIPLIEAIAATGKILAFHIGSDAFEQTHPFRLGKIAKRFPETRILAVHMGGVGHRDLTSAMIETAAECANITLIGSEVKTKAVLKAIQVLGADRVCFGSDSPFELMHVEVAKYNALLDGEISPEDKALVMGGNIVGLIGKS